MKTAKNSIKTSLTKYATRKAAQAEFTEKLKSGRSYIHGRRNSIMILELSKQVTCAVELDNIAVKEGLIDEAGVLAFAFKNPKDSYSIKVAKGVLGHNLNHGIDLLFLPLDEDIFSAALLGSRVAKDLLSSMAIYTLVTHVVAKNIDAPGWFRRNTFQHIFGVEAYE